MAEEDILVRVLIIIGLLLFLFRPTREFIWRRMDFFLPFVLGSILGLILVPILAMGNVPRILVFSFPIATGGIVATKTRHWFKDLFQGDGDGKDVDR
jgi:hypothetical protein